jgi:hypothetical protein
LEFKLLEQLMRQTPRVVTRTMLLEQVWGFHFDPKTSVVETHMSRLRGKIDKGFDCELIHTARGSATLCERPMHLASSLIFRLTTLYAILFAASVAILFALVWLVTSRSMTAQIMANVQREAISLADEYRATGTAAAAAVVERRLQRGGLAYYLLQRRDGSGLPATSPRLTSLGPSRPPGAASVPRRSER